MKKTTLREIACPLCCVEDYTVLYPSTLTSRDFQYKTLVKHVKNTLDDFTKHAQIVKCNNCCLIFTSPMEDLSKILKAYEDVVDTQYLQTEKFRKILLSEHLQKLQEYKKSGKVLDVGAFAGFFLELAKNNGLQAYGIEPSKWAGKIAKERGFVYKSRNILTAKLPTNFYDAVTMWDVIEHIAYPHMLIKIVHKSLKKGGILAIGTPDIGSVYAKILRGNCPFLIRMHIILYSRQTLVRLLEQEGFRILNISYYGRTFPISYFVEKLSFKYAIVGKVFGWTKNIRLFQELGLTLNFRDSIRVIAQKI